MPHVTLSNFSQTYSPLFSLKLGTLIMVVASSPSNTTEILKTHDRVFSSRSVPHVMPINRSELNDISLVWSLECGDGWKYLRTICRTELFSGKAIVSQAYLREKKVMEVVKFISGRGEEGKVVNIGERAFTTVYNMLSNVLLSKDIFSFENDNCEGKELKALVRKVMEMAMPPNISDLYPILRGLDLQGIKRIRSLGEMISAYWAAIIKERKENPSSRNRRDFLDTRIENHFADACINTILQVITRT